MLDEPQRGVLEGGNGGQSAAPIADLVARQFAQQPGNYLAFFSSFDYLRQVAALLAKVADIADDFPEAAAYHPGLVL